MEIEEEVKQAQRLVLDQESTPQQHQSMESTDGMCVESGDDSQGVKRPAATLQDELVPYLLFAVDPLRWEATDKIGEVGYMYVHNETDRPLVVVNIVVDKLNEVDGSTEKLRGYDLIFELNEHIPQDRAPSFRVMACDDVEKTQYNMMAMLATIDEFYRLEENLPGMIDMEVYYTGFLAKLDMTKERHKIRKIVTAQRQLPVNS